MGALGRQALVVLSISRHILSLQLETILFFPGWVVGLKWPTDLGLASRSQCAGGRPQAGGLHAEQGLVLESGLPGTHAHTGC